MSTITKVDTRSCPKCNSTNVHKFKDRGLGLVWRLIGFRCYRCSTCGHNFNRYRGWRTIHTRILLGTLLLAGFIFLTWYMLGRMGTGIPPLPTE